MSDLIRQKLKLAMSCQNNPAIAPRDAAIEYINLFPDKEEGRKRWKQH